MRYGIRVLHTVVCVLLFGGAVGLRADDCAAKAQQAQDALMKLSQAMSATELDWLTEANRLRDLEKAQEAFSDASAADLAARQAWTNATKSYLECSSVPLRNCDAQAKAQADAMSALKDAAGKLAAAKQAQRDAEKAWEDADKKVENDRKEEEKARAAYQSAVEAAKNCGKKRAKG